MSFLFPKKSSMKVISDQYREVRQTINHQNNHGDRPRIRIEIIFSATFNKLLGLLAYDV